MKSLDTKEVKKKIQNLEKIIVQVGANWCGPCKQLKPTMEEISQEELGVEFVYIDVDQNPDFAQEYGIRGIPTVIFFNNGQRIDAFTGNQSKGQIKDFIRKNS